MALWHNTHDWKKLAWLWNDGAPGAPLKLDVVWHCRQSKLTLLSFNMWGFGPPCVKWQDWHPSVFTGWCSNTNGPCLSVWHLKQIASCVEEVRTCLGPTVPCTL